jgi:16S rRNA (guanine966-N2)-methyltransferase
MRVIGGTYRSRLLKSLKGTALRPTSDRLRETLFNVLTKHVAGARFLDLFAGTGAVGIEALSRGAAEVVFVEKHVPAAALIRKNLGSLGVPSGATVLAIDVLRGLEKLASLCKPGDALFDLVFLDPPYAAVDEYENVLKFLGATTILAAGCIVIAEHRRTVEMPGNPGALMRVRTLKQGDACLSFYRFQLSQQAEIPQVA